MNRATVRITGHAWDQMRERDIPEDAVYWVLEHYDTRRPAPPRAPAPPAVRYVGDYAGKRLKVYVELDSNPIRVKTAAWEGD